MNEAAERKSLVYYFICLNFVREIFFVRELHPVKYFIIGIFISQGKPREIIISHLDI